MVFHRNLGHTTQNNHTGMHSQSQLRVLVQVGGQTNLFKLVLKKIWLNPVEHGHCSALQSTRLRQTGARTAHAALPPGAADGKEWGTGDTSVRIAQPKIAAGLSKTRVGVACRSCGLGSERRWRATSWSD